MTLLETIYSELRQAGLVENAEDFSINYLGRSKHWYAFQKHAQRDFSVGAAIQCLRSVQSHSKTAGSQRSTLQRIIAQLRGHLNEHHGIAEVCPS
jgi:hypothetical protein